MEGVENIVGKGKNPVTSIFLFSNCEMRENFMKKEEKNWLTTLSQTSPFFTFLQYMSFENTAGKGEIARNE